MTLEELRRRIDEIDQQILQLLAKRGNLALEVGQKKRERGEDAYAPDRERQILAAIQQANQGPLDKVSLKAIFNEIVSACRSLEKPTRVAFLGPLGTFSHVAARSYFGSSAEFLPLPSFRDVVKETEKGNADFGILPVENSTDGPLGETLDLMAESTLSMCGETYVEVHHCLLSRSPLGEIAKVYSLPIVLRQCQAWLRNNLPRAHLLEAGSTADAAQKVAKEPDAAAIATGICAEIYGLEIVAENIEDLSHNRTRFALLGNRPTEPTGKDKTSLLFSTKHQPGTLCSALSAFERAQLNLMMIQSRPDRRTPWEYVFFVDFTGHQQDENVKQALAELRPIATYIRILGSYPEGE